MSLTPPNYGPRPKQSTAIDNDGNVVDDGVPIVVEGGKVNFGTANLIEPHSMGGRLTLSSTDPAPEATIGSSGTIYYLAYIHNLVTLWDGAQWRHHTLPSGGITKLLSGFNVAISANTNYDVFMYDNNGTLDLYAVAWSGNTTRASTISRSDGVYSLNSDRTKRYVGTFRANGSNTTIFTAAQGENGVDTKLWVWNMNNRVEYTSTWLYDSFWTTSGSPISTISTQGFGPSGGAFSNATFSILVGLLEDHFQARCFMAPNVATLASGSITIAIAVTSSTSTLVHRTTGTAYTTHLDFGEITYRPIEASCNQRFTAVGLNALTASYTLQQAGSGGASVFFENTQLGSPYIAIGFITTMGM